MKDDVARCNLEIDALIGTLDPGTSAADRAMRESLDYEDLLHWNMILRQFVRAQDLAQLRRKMLFHLERKYEAAQVLLKTHGIDLKEIERTREIMDEAIAQQDLIDACEELARPDVEEKP